MRTIASMLLLAGCGPGRADFWLNKGDYVAVVELVQAQPLPEPGALAEWAVDDLDRPQALRAVQPADRMRGSGRGLVWATAAPDGALSVFIETHDRGHAGEWGVAFVEPGGALWDHDAHGERWFVAAELGGGWYLLKYDLG